MNTTRSEQEIITLLIEDKSLSYGDRVALGIEAYISRLPKEKQAKAWQELPYLVQFGPVLLKRGKKLPDIRWVNPGIEYGGLTQYDKTTIQNKFTEQFKLKEVSLGETMPDFDDAVAMVPSFPVMKKVDKGERGVGVWFLADLDALKEHWKAMNEGIIERQPSSFQEYCSYNEEYCLQFYQEYNDTGEIEITCGGLSLRDIPIVIGDGKSTLKELIMELNIAPQHKKNIIEQLKTIEANRLYLIPKDGVEETIVRTASIDFGTVYKTIRLDEKQTERAVSLLTSLLENISPEFISVGRFDLKTNSLEALLDKKVKIIECNAGGGIPTAVYDEGLTIDDKYLLLNEHFGVMNNISQKNKEKKSVIASLLAWPELLYISYKSFSQKGLSLFSGDKEKTKHIKEIYKHIFDTLSVGYKGRWKNRLEKVL